MKVTHKVKMKSGFPASVIMNLVNMYMYMWASVCVCARLTEISTSGKRSELSIIKRSVNYNGGQVAQLPGHVRTVACASLSFAVWHKQKTCFISSTSLIVIQAPSGNWVYS